MAFSDEELTWEKLQGIANRPTTIAVGPYRTKYAPGQNNTIMDSIYRFAGQSQPQNAPKFGEGPLEFALREKGFGADISQLRDQARNLQREYPDMKADALADLIRSVQKPVAPQAVHTPDKIQGLAGLDMQKAHGTAQQSTLAQNPVNDLEARRKAAWGDNYVTQVPTQSPEEIQRIKQANADVFLNSIRGKGLPPELAGQRPQVVEQIRGGQVVKNEFGGGGERFFDAYGNELPTAKMFDQSGNPITEAELQQIGNMNTIRQLANRASDFFAPNKASLETLKALGGLKAAETGAEAAQGLARARNLNVDADLAPGLARSTMAQHYASANKMNTDAGFMSREQVRQDRETDAKVSLYGAQADHAKAEAVKAMRGSGADTKLIQAILKESMGKVVDPATGTETPSYNPQVAEQLMQAAGIKRAKTAKPQTRAEAMQLFKQRYPTATPEQLMKTLDYYGFKDE